MKRLLLCVLAAGSLAAVAEPASAQIFTPTYQAPRSSSDRGIYLADGPGKFAIEGILRRGYGGYDVGLRGGIADTQDLSVLLGADLRNPLTAGTAPIDLAITAGIQALLLGDARGLGLQGGLSIGHTFVPAGGGFNLTPYIHPRVALVDWGAPADGFDAELVADVGLDFAMRSGLLFRLGISISDLSSDWGIGLAWR